MLKLTSVLTHYSDVTIRTRENERKRGERK